MSLFFLAEIHIALPDYLTGTARFQNINKMITFHAAWKEEAFECLQTLLSTYNIISGPTITIINWNN